MAMERDTVGGIPRVRCALTEAAASLPRDSVVRLEPAGDLEFELHEYALGRRLDRFLGERFRFLSRSSWQKAIRLGLVEVDGRRVKPSLILRAGMRCRIAARVLSSMRMRAAPESVEIIHRDEWIVAFNKPAGLILHPTSPLTKGGLCELGAELAGGPIYTCHRLDRFTSGAVVFSASSGVAPSMSAVFEQRRIDKRYVALVEGCFPWREIEVDEPIGRDDGGPVRLRRRVGGADARPARTTFRTLLRLEIIDDSGRDEGLRRFTLVEAVLHTGRQHQIRVHLAWLGYPVVRDKLYGPSIDVEFFERGWASASPFYPDWHALHCLRMRFEHPVEGGPVCVEADTVRLPPWRLVEAVDRGMKSSWAGLVQLRQASSSGKENEGEEQAAGEPQYPPSDYVAWMMALQEYARYSDRGGQGDEDEQAADGGPECPHGRHQRRPGGMGGGERVFVPRAQQRLDRPRPGTPEEVSERRHHQQVHRNVAQGDDHRPGRRREQAPQDEQAVAHHRQPEHRAHLEELPGLP